MNERDHVNEVINRMVNAINRHDVEACVGCYGEDILLQDPLYPDPVRGIEHIRTAFRYWFEAFPDVQVQVMDRIIDGPKVALEWTYEATHVGKYMDVPASGQRFRMLTVAIFRVENGKITRDFSLFDGTALRMLEKLAKTGPSATA